MNSNNNPIITELRRLVGRKNVQNEKECGKQLKLMPEILLPPFDGVITYIDCEQSCSSGRVDMIIIADVIQTDGTKHREGFVWELKAPQLHLFKIETKNRASPTNEFFEAENQLLHYYDSVKGDRQLRNRWDILPGNVKMGGLIIGRHSTFVKAGNEDPLLAHHLANQALNIRKSTLYRSHSIRIWTWDMVLYTAENLTFSYQQKVGQPKEYYDYGASPVLSASTDIIRTLPSK